MSPSQSGASPMTPRLDAIRERLEAQPRDYHLETIEGRINASFDLVMADGDRAFLLAEVERLRGIEHAARDVDGMWDEPVKGSRLVWMPEAGEALFDLRDALREAKS